jgi:hypothetical protein
LGATLSVTNAATFNSNATVAGNLTVNGNTTIGNASSDTLTISAQLASSLVPNTTSTYNLGSASSIYSIAYVDQICFDGSSDCITSSAAAASAAGWTDNGTQVYLLTSTDNVTVGSSTNLAKFGVDGDTDEIQLLAQGNATQTSNILVIEKSDGTDLFTVGPTGNGTLAGTFTAQGAATFNSTLDVTGNTTVGGTFGSTGAATFSSTITATGLITGNGGLSISSGTVSLPCGRIPAPPRKRE